MTSVTIPNSVTSIGGYAFSNTGIQTPVYNENVFAYMPVDYEGGYAVPDGIKSVAGGAFSGCIGLTSVEWNAKKCSNFNFYYSSSSKIYPPFYDCPVTTFTFGNDVEHIPAYLCYKLSGLTSVTIPNSVTFIGSSAFSGCCGLTSVTIPNSVTSIEDWAFSGCCGLTSVTIPNSVTSIEDWAFSGCRGLTSVTIPNSVTSIGAGAFSGCRGLTSVVIPNSVTSIGDRAFHYCSGLTSVTIPNSVTSIGSSAFYGCSGLTSVTIPNSVTSIGEKAFYGCSGLTSVEWNAKKCSNFDYSSSSGIYPPFYGCPVTTFTFGNEVEHIPAYLCYECSGLTSVEWNAKRCADFDFNSRPFESSTSITTFTFGNEVEHIPAYLCYECSGLTSVTILNSVTSIGEYVFYDTRIPTPVYNENVFAYMPKSYEGGYAVPDGIKSVAGGAFDGCRRLTSVTIPNSVTSIGEKAFSGCSGLTLVEWNVKKCADFDLDSRPFHSCTSITTFTFGNEVEHIPASLCFGLTGLTSVTIPSSVTSIGEYVFYDTRIPTPVYNENVFAYMPVIHEGGYAVPDGIKSVAGGAFYRCSGLTSVTIPNSVTSIGMEAFSYCSGLTSVTIGNSVKYIEGGAFYACSGLKSVYVYAAEPPLVLGYGILGHGASSSSVKFYVPEASLAAYRSAKVWKEYFILPMSVLEMCAVTVSSNDAAMGTVSGGGEYHKGATVSLTATANEGYRFVKWSDGKTDNPRVIIVNENITLTAEFAKEIGTAVDTPDESSVTVIAGDGTITVYGADGETVTVYNVHGTCVYHGTGNEPTEIQVPAAGVYIVRTKGTTVKVAVR